MTTRGATRLATLAAIAAGFGIAAGCGGSGDAGESVEPLPAGAGTYFSTDFLGLGGFYRLDEFSGEIELQVASAEYVAPGTGSCPALAALDARSDGLVLGVARGSAMLHEVDTRKNLCRGAVALAERMAAIAVRADGRMFVVSAANTLHELDGQARPVSSRPLVCATPPGPCPVRGIDFAADGTLYAIVAGGSWSRIDVTTGQVALVRASVGLSDDFDIDAQGQVRGLAGNELRRFDLQGRASGRAVNVFGGTAFATGVVNR